MSSKVVEADAGVHSLAMAVAVSSVSDWTFANQLQRKCVCLLIQPVTSWRLYGRLNSTT
jgi:hypothetical protein